MEFSDVRAGVYERLKSDYTLVMPNAAPEAVLKKVDADVDLLAEIIWYEFSKSRAERQDLESVRTNEASH